MKRTAIFFSLLTALGAANASTAFASDCLGKPTGASCSEGCMVGVCLDGTCRVICQGADCFPDGGACVEAAPPDGAETDGGILDGGSTPSVDGAPIDRDLPDGGTDDALPDPASAPSPSVPPGVPAPVSTGVVTPLAEPGDPPIPDVRGSGFDQGCDFAASRSANSGLLALILVALLLAFRAHRAN